MSGGIKPPAFAQRQPMAAVRGHNGETPAFDRKAKPAARVRTLSASIKPALNTSIRKGDESMRASKLITLSAIAVLVGGASLATDLAIAQTQQSGSSMQGSSLNKGSAPKRSMSSHIPRLSSVGTPVRIDAVVPQSVRQAAVPLPPQVQRMEPRFRNDRVFKYRDQVVIVDPKTSRIVAIVKAPT